LSQHFVVGQLLIRLEILRHVGLDQDGQQIFADVIALLEVARVCRLDGFFLLLDQMLLVSASNLPSA
jgi:hypothetical protein